MTKLIISKIERYLFYFLLFAIPFQTRKILWYQNWNFNEWQSFSVYSTDLILLALFVFWAFNYFYGRKFIIFNFKFLNKSQFQNPDFYLIVFLVISAISIKNSSDHLLSAWSVLRLVEFSIFYFYLKNYAIYKFGFSTSLLIIMFGGMFQAIIAILQFLKQSDLGLRYFGESILAPNLTGVASFYNLHGEKIMRAYGTTPHPNVVAAYLFLAIFASYFIWFYKKIRYEYLFWLGYAFMLFSFFFTFARVAIFLLGMNFIIRGTLLITMFKKKFWHGRTLKVIWVTGLIILVFVVFYWSEVFSRIKISGDEEAVQLRIFYNKESLKSLDWFGVGLGNFVNWLMVKDPNLSRSLYQPVHNIYLLIFSETGILGISTFLLFLVFIIKNFVLRTKLERFHHYSLILVFSSFVFMGVFDHFLWTLQQGRFVLWIVIALLTINESDDIIIKQQS